MGNICKIKDEYFIEFYARGLLYQQKAGKDIEHARRLLAEIEEKIRQGEMGTIVRDVDIDIFFQTFLESARKEHSPKSCIRFKSLIGHFAVFLKQQFPDTVKLSGITPAVIDQYRLFLLKSQTTLKLINFTLILLRIVLEYGLKLGYINDNPTLHVLFCDFSAPKRPRTLTQQDIEKLIKGCAKDQQDLFLFLARTGVRIEEALGLCWQNVDFQKRSLRITPTSKESAGREIPMDPEIFVLLSKLFAAAKGSNLVFADGYSRTQLKDYLTGEIHSGDKVSLQIFRHSFARRLLENGVAPVRVCELMGFDDIARIMYYWRWVPVGKLLV